MAKTMIEELEERKTALSVKELAALLNVSQNAIYDAINGGKLSSMRVGTTVRLDPRLTAEWLRKSLVTA